MDGPSNVVEVTTTTSEIAMIGQGYGRADGEVVRPVCNTPCAADFPFGGHLLKITPIGREEDGTTTLMADVGAKPSVLRVGPRFSRRQDGWSGSGAAFQFIGVLGAGTGGALAAAFGPDDAKFGAASVASLGLGTGIFAVGLLVSYLSRGEVRDASSFQWTPAAAPTGTDPILSSRR